MSLFENSLYQWRDTYFILFDLDNRPILEDVRAVFESFGSLYEINEINGDEQGLLASAMITSPSDFSAMDISFMSGEEILEQKVQLLEELDQDDLTEEEINKLKCLPSCNARFDIFHFERINEGEEDEFFDPGSLLFVLQKFAEMCHGVGIDPQSGSVV